MQNEVRCAVQQKQHLLHQAFDILKTQYRDREVVTKEIFQRVVIAVDPSKTTTHINLFLCVLDRTGDGFIGTGNLNTDSI